MAEEQPEEVKVEARQFMSDVLSAAATENTFQGGDGVDMKAWKEIYSSATTKDGTLMEKFWNIYDPKSTSIWTMVYDEADSNENLDQTIEIATSFMKNTESLKDHCFGIIHTLDSLEVEGLWFFNGPDPEQLFGTNEDTSWFTWNQVGPDPNDHVKAAVAAFLAPTDGQLNGKVIKNTQAFC